MLCTFKKITFLLLLSTLISCKETRDTKNEHIYEIISMLNYQLTGPLKPPPIPEGVLWSKEDSLKISKHTEERESVKQIIAVNPTLKKPRQKEYKIDSQCIDFENLLKKFTAIEDETPINLLKIDNKRRDSIIFFRNGLLNEFGKAYEKFDILIEFSQISFNKTYDKAIITADMSRSRIAGGGYIYFLERKENKWVVKCSYMLYMS